MNRVLPREVAQAVKGSNDTRFYGVPASTWIINDLWHCGKRRTGAEVNNSITLIGAASCSGPQWFRNVCKFATDLRVRKGQPRVLLLVLDLG